MLLRRRPRLRAPAVAVLLVFLRFAAAEEPHDTQAVLWTDPGDIAARNLFWGEGGEQGQPRPPVKFIAEDLAGTNPKFDVRDQAGVKWRVKLGSEAQPEVVASRLLWAVGYSANQNYFLPLLHVENMPAHLRRGQKLAGHGGDVPKVRLQRRPEGEKKTKTWDWRHNPFFGTREFNGLRVMMALIRDWDLYDENNAILRDKDDPGHEIYEVSDVGTAFGTSGRRYRNEHAKGNLDAYRRGRLIRRIAPDSIDLRFPTLPPLSFIINLPFYLRQVRMRWIGQHIPRADARWIGSLLARLSRDQIRDAFRAAGYPPPVVEAYSTIVKARIQELNSL